MKRLITILMVFALSVAIPLCAQANKTKKKAKSSERSVELNVVVPLRGGISTQGVNFPRGASFGGGLEAYLMPGRLSMGFTFLHEGSGGLDIQGSKASMARNTFTSDFNIYAFPDKKFRPYGTVGQGVVYNKINLDGTARSQASYGFKFGGGFKYDFRRISVGPYAGLVTGGRVLSKQLGVTLSWRWK